VDENTGCISEEQDFMTVNISGGPLTVEAEVEAEVVCDGDGTQLFALGSGGNFPVYEYSWSSIPASFIPDSANPYVVPVVSTDYIVEIYDEFNYDYDTIRIEVSAPPPVNLGADVMACPYDSVELNVLLPGLNYYWSNGDTASKIKVGSTGIGYDAKTYSVEVWDELGCTGADEVTVYFDFSYCFGISEGVEQLHAEIFPNPSNGYFTLRLEGEKGNLDISIFNVHGMEIYHNMLDISVPGSFETRIILPDAAPGIYITRVVQDKKVVVGRLIVE